ncbi:R3H domain-containing nucleic acid-binding protein [Tumidithrix elongata RA019]|uniref:R3H domain-containing nucleic acid-binding protein n=1 Tax=Tumidithrix elongata BACA0141 TaxID=2716417 RepID=A0AAW9PSF0_9CYAN|nr:R3H domain-containing nucleic acid-binding protein [Tumidithrix elongata RA019]
MSQAEVGVKWLTHLLELMGYLCTVRAELKANSDPEVNTPNYWLEIDHSSLRPHQIQALIGMDGSTLDAMQYLTNTTLNMHLPSEEDHCFYTIELNGYRAKRQVELQQLAEQAADRVRETQQEYAIKNLSSAERRQVHMFLKGFSDIETLSQGKEPHRHLIVRLVQN